MPRFNKIHAVGHKAEDMFDLVADVECYPEFLPMCEKLVVRSRRTKGEKERILADMSVAYQFIRESFTSQVTLYRPDLLIDVQYIDGPFRYLDNQWHFEAKSEDSCNVHFEIDYEFKSKALGLLLGNMFELVFSRFTKAFEERADQVYGKS